MASLPTFKPECKPLALPTKEDSASIFCKPNKTRAKIKSIQDRSSERLGLNVSAFLKKPHIMNKNKVPMVTTAVDFVHKAKMVEIVARIKNFPLPLNKYFAPPKRQRVWNK